MTAVPMTTDWTQHITAAWNKSRDSIIETGRLLAEAKAELPHGAFETMVENELPFKPSTARMLMTIGRDNRIANRDHGNVLPNSWRTLYELTRLPDDRFHELIENGTIHPEMQRKDIPVFDSLRKQNGSITCATEDLQSLIDQGLTFGTVYADPPWGYGNQGTRAHTGKHYKSMSVEEIAALPIQKLVADEAHLHFWTTNAFLFEARAIMEAWGFEYKSCFVWVKPQMGIGNYWRVSHEFLLLGVRSNLTFPDKSLMSWAELPRGRHSAKPERVRQLIERVSPSPRLELFGRLAVDNWVVWGNEIERDIFTASAREVA